MLKLILMKDNEAYEMYLPLKIPMIHFVLSLIVSVIPYTRVPSLVFFCYKEQLMAINISKNL